MTRRAAARAALAEGWPVFLVAVVAGATYGIVARQAGLTVLEASGSSLIVFAGASQFASLELLRAGASAPAVAFAIALVNARHILMATAIRPHLAGVPIVRRLGLAYVLTDEAFALGIAWFRRGRREVTYYAVFGVGLWACWNAATLAGALFGGTLEHTERLGIDFTIAAIFVAIVATTARHRADIAVALAAAAVAAVVRIAGASTPAVIVAGALAPALAIALRGEDR